MRFRIIMALCALCLWSLPIGASSWLVEGELQTELSHPTLVIDGYELSRDELDEFYKRRDYRPAWSFAGTDNAKAVANFLDSLSTIIVYHGLQRDAYPIDLMQKLANSSDSAAQNRLELVVTDSLLYLAHDLHGDNLNLDDLYPGWNFHRDNLNIVEELSNAITANQLNSFINQITPKHPSYLQLAKALQEYRTIAAHGGWQLIDARGALQPQDRGPRVMQLRARLIAEGYNLPQNQSADQDNLYDEQLLKAVISYQKKNGFDQDGKIGPKTLASLNIPVEARIDQIRANMERWRHMPEIFPPARYTLVNIPSMNIDIMDKSKILYHGPVIIGRVDRKTPFIQSTIRSMIINPSWHVPTQIAQKDILPKLRKDPHYLEKLGFVISGSADDPHGDMIDWNSIKEHEFDFRLRQSPGDMNSLGRLKFDFDNDFSVYMHGTPHQELFQKSDRHLSSGCVRLRDPQQVAAILMESNTGNWTPQRIEDEISSNKTRWVKLEQPMPLFVVYWTVFSDETGEVNFRTDTYNYDLFLINAMKGLMSQSQAQNN